MTLTLDQIRDTKFHVAKRGGYEVTEVDRFVDQVEESFAQLTDESASLKKQVDSLKSAQTNAQRTTTAPQGADPAVGKLTEENAALKRQVDTLRTQTQQLTAQAAARQNEAGEREQETTRITPPAPAPAAPAAVVEGGTEKLVVSTTPEASAAVVRLVQLHTEQAERLVTEAESEARRKVDEANQKANQITNDARTRADRIESEARVSAEKVSEEAKANADDLGRQVASRRTELFAELETERDQLQVAVEQLRTFEDRFRTNFSRELRSTLDSVERTTIEPSDPPSLAKRGNASGLGSSSDQPVTGARTAGNGGSSSSTPRLDALLGEGNS